MKREIHTYNEIVGFHKYDNAPDFCSYLRERHRHVFVISCTAEVSHNQREIEFNQLQLEIEKKLHDKFGNPCEFGNMSCESIAEMLLTEFCMLNNVKVLEDNYGGASLSR